MTTFEKLEKALSAKGWHYDAGNQGFRNGKRRLDYRRVLALVPGMTIEELAAYQDDQYTKFCKRRVRPT